MEIRERSEQEMSVTLARFFSSDDEKAGMTSLGSWCLQTQTSNLDIYGATQSLAVTVDLRGEGLRAWRMAKMPHIRTRAR